MLIWGFVLLIIGVVFGRAHEHEGEHYTELYEAAVRLAEAGQDVQNAAAMGTQDQLLRAGLHWHDAVAAVGALRPGRTRGRVR